MNERPLSPHLQIYRLPLTAMLSITHRVTGIFLVVGMIMLVVFLVAVSEGEGQFLVLQSFVRSALGSLLTWGWIYSLFFHSCHGVRHLVWDTGHGFDAATLSRFAYLEVAASIALTITVFALTYFKFH